jgi:transporter family-2 protein
MAALAVALLAVAGLGGAVQVAVMGTLGERVGVFPALAFSTMVSIFAMTVAAPRIWTAATIGVVIAGNLAMGAAIDRYGLFGLDRIPLTWTRIVGLLLLAAGAALSLAKH